MGVVIEDRRDPDIVVFGVEDGLWVNSSVSHNSVSYNPVSYSSESHTAESHAADEVRQGDDPARQRHPIPASVARLRDRLRDRVTVGCRRMKPQQIAFAVAALVVVAFVAGVLVGRRSPHQPAVVQAGGFIPFTASLGFPAPTSRGRFVAPDPLHEQDAGPRVTVAASEVYAMQLKSTPVNQARQSQETRDAGAAQGPWSVIVRRSNGSLGRRGAVITYPVPSVTIGRAVRIAVAPRVTVAPSTGQVTSVATSVTGHEDEAGGIVWPLNGKFARIRSDLGRSAMAALAARVSIRSGRPALTGLAKGYRVIVSEPYRAPVVTESRYTDSLRVDSGPIDGLIYSEVVIGGASFEEALYSEITVPGGTISGHPAVRSPVGGGSATLAWEVAPGIVAFVGYAGGLVPSAATPSLTELARGGALLSRAQWTATHPSTNRGENDYS